MDKDLKFCGKKGNGDYHGKAGIAYKRGLEKASGGA